jgi:putative transposase
MCHIELDPVCAVVVEDPQNYRWSSVHTHLGLVHDPLITPHSLYLELGSTVTERWPIDVD